MKVLSKLNSVIYIDTVALAPALCICTHRLPTTYMMDPGYNIRALIYVVSIAYSVSLSFSPSP